MLDEPCIDAVPADDDIVGDAYDEVDTYVDYFQDVLLLGLCDFTVTTSPSIGQMLTAEDIAAWIWGR